MEIVNVIIQFLIYSIECFIIWRILSGLLEVKYHKQLPILFSAGMFLLLVLKHIIVTHAGNSYVQTLGSFTIMVYLFLCFQLFFKNSFIEKLIWWGIYYFSIVTFEIITMFILKLILNKNMIEFSNDQISLYFIVLGKIILLLLFEFIIHRRKSGIVIGISYFKELAFLILFNLVLLLSAVYVFSNSQRGIIRFERIAFFIFAVVLIITVNTAILIFRLEKKSREELDTRLRMQQVELELKMNEDMITVTDKLRKLRHDMNNHIGLIKSLVKLQKYEELQEYINQIYEDVEIANELIITGNKTLSVLLNAKKNMAKAKHIDFTSIVANQDINMQSKDICALLGNILDNAIEAAEKSGNKKYIQLVIQRTDEGCIINCENSLGVRPIVKKGKFVTMKKDTDFHGIGIENIKDIVSKYNGEISFDYDEDMFNVRVVIPA